MSETKYTLETLHAKEWFKKLPASQRELLQQSFYLIEDIEYKKKTFYDYSFIVMPAAKAYEGFVKDMLFRLGLISEKRYTGKRFRVGKALNPALAQSDPNSFEALYDDLENLYHSKELPELLWQTWKECRNKIFHYFIDNTQHITLHEAKERLQQILTAIEKAQSICAVAFQPSLQ
ncbi:MAG: hypothetical protein ACOX6V_01590 [Patescibacteria group bacterium]|jgi:hypothetical protein